MPRQRLTGRTPTTARKNSKKLDRLLVLLEAAPGMRILEPGCGTGRLTTVLGKAVGVEGAVTALDISVRMANAARRRCAEQKQVQVLQGCLETCSLSVAQFDAVACHQVFPHFNDHVRALDRMARCLRPSGRLVISHFIGREEVNDVHRKAGTVVEKGHAARRSRYARPVRTGRFYRRSAGRHCERLLSFGPPDSVAARHGQPKTNTAEAGPSTFPSRTASASPFSAPFPTPSPFSRTNFVFQEFLPAALLWLDKILFHSIF